MDVVDAEPLVDVVGLVGAEVGTVSFPPTPDPGPETHNIDTPTHNHNTSHSHTALQHCSLLNSVFTFPNGVSGLPISSVYTL